MPEVWVICVLFFVCVIGSICDARTRKIPVMVIVSVFTISIILFIMNKPNEYWLENMVMRMAPGLALCLLALICRGKIGMGDGIIVIGIGIGIGLPECLTMLTFALFANALVAGGLLAIKKVGKNYEIAFLPFITAGLAITFAGKLLGWT